MLKKCTYITDMSIYYDDEQRIVIIGSRSLHLRTGQYTLVALLLKHQEVDDTTLSQTLYQQEANSDTRLLITKGISRLRTRLRIYDLDIKRIHDYGYRLVYLVVESL